MRPLLLALLLPGVATAAGFQRLHAQEATSTSFLKSNWNKYEENYHPSYVLDDDPKTAWVEGAEGDGAGESLTVPLSTLKSARAIRLVIFNGFQKSAGLLSANAAPRQLTVTVRGPGENESARQQLTLARKMGPQSFDIPVSGGVSEVVLTVDSVHPGSKYRDTCISDVQVFVDSDVPYNAAVEKSKREAMLQWKKERVAAAKYFAALPKTYPYASTHFELEHESKLLSKRYAQVIDKDQDGYAEQGMPAKDFVPLMTQVQQGTISGPLEETDKALLKELEGLMRSGAPKEGKWYSLARKERTVLPEGLRFPAPMEPLLHPSDMTLFEAKGLGSLTPNMSVAGGIEQGEMISHLLLLEGSATDVKKVYFIHKLIAVDRVTTSNTTHLIATLEGGKLQRLVGLRHSKGSDEEEGDSTEVDVMIPSYRDGKVSGLSLFELTDYDARYDGADPEAGIRLTKTSFEAQPNS